MIRFLVLACALLVTLTGPITAVAHSSADHDVVLDAVRSRWPIAREPGGQWGVVGEVTAAIAPGPPATVRAVRVSLLDDRRRLLARHVFDTPEALAAILRVASADGSDDPWREPGTVWIGPGERAVVFVAELVANRPSWALVSVEIAGRNTTHVMVPLDVYQPAQRLTWPTGTSDRPWVATGTAGTPPHSQGGTVVVSGRVFVSQRFALDLRQIDGQFRTHPEGATTKESYYAWGAPVLSMGRGLVVAAVDADPDFEIGEPIPSTQHPAGNYIVVQHGPASFAVYAHLQRGSVAVRVGEWVDRSQEIAKVGNSGSSSEPHLHVHVADRWRRDVDPLAAFVASHGVPALFWGGAVWRDGAWIPLRGTTPTELDIVVPGP